MPPRITLTALLALRPCDPDRLAPLFGKRKSLTVAQALDAGATVPDVLWVLAHAGHLPTVVAFAEACAARVAHHTAADAPRAAAYAYATDAALAYATAATHATAAAYPTVAAAAERAATAAANAAAYAYAPRAAAYAAEREAQTQILRGLTT